MSGVQIRGGDETVTSPKLSLKTRTLRAGSWTVVAHVCGQLLRLLSSLVMTRILVPEMFGIMAIAIVVQVIVALLSDIGLRQAIVQSPRGGAPEFLDSAWSMQVVRGWLIWGVCVLVAVALYGLSSAHWVPPASVYAAAILPAVIASTSFASAIGGFSSTRSITANRDLDLRRVTLIELIAQVVGLALMLGLGWWTRSIWSVVAGVLLTALVSVVLSHTWLPGHRNRFRFDADSVREIISFGRWIFISSALGVLAANSDRLILGVWLSASALGFYAIALNLATVVEGLAYKLFGTVSFAVFSEAARDTPGRLRELYFRMRLPADVAFLASAGFLYAAGPAIVGSLYDHRYIEAGPILQILSFCLFFTRFSLCTSVYMAISKPQYLTVIQLLNIVSLFAFVPMLYWLFDAPGAVWAVALYRLPSSIAVIFYNNRHGIHSTLFEFAVLPTWGAGWLIGLGVSLLLPHR